MSARTEAIAELVDQHYPVLEAWSTRRCQREGDLSLHKIKARVRGYIVWFGTLRDALRGFLNQRSWHSIRTLVDKSVADGVAQARQTPADSSDVSALLPPAFFLNVLLENVKTFVIFVPFVMSHWFSELCALASWREKIRIRQIPN